MSPRQASHFLCLAKESNQRKATPLCASLRFATGNLRCSLFAGSAQTRCAQTARGPDPRKAALLGTHRGEVVRAIAALGHQRPRYARPGHVHASITVMKAISSTSHSERLHVHVHVDVHVDVQRERGLGAHANPHPQKDAPWRVGVQLPSGRAEERSFSRIRAASCLSAASLRGPREKRAPQVARSEAEGRGQWGRLFLVTFFWRSKRK